VPKDVATTPDEVFRHLVRRGASVDLGMAAARGDLPRVREWLARDPSLANRVSDYGSYYLGCGAPLKNAAAAGHLDIVRLLLEHGADPNLPEEGIAPHGHALYAAVANRHYDIVRLLLDHGANPNAEVESSADALSRALLPLDQRMVDLLCSYGASRPVHLLAHYDDLRTAAAVFAANPALADDPEAFANAAGDAFVRLMLRYQPDLPRRVTTAKSRPTTELLFRHGMDPSRPDWLGVTPLHEFARRGDVENAAFFLDHGADLHARDEDLQSSPLGWAAKFGQLEMVELLLRRGARTRLPDDPSWAVPLAWAERREHREIADVLRHHERWGVLPPRLPRDHYESLAADLVEAVTTDAPDATRRIATDFRLPLSVSARDLRDHLDRRGIPVPESRSISPAHAREVVARLHGYADWAELETHLDSRARAHVRVAIRESAEQAIVRGDAAALENLLVQHPEVLRDRLPSAPPAPGSPPDSLATHARTLVARAHAFDSWDRFAAHLDERNRPGSAVARFEQAVDAIVAGDLEALDRLLHGDPNLVRARSDRRHRATLLHYVGANGVEEFRQVTPVNAPGIAERLLRSGAEVDALASLYGGSTTLGLAATSIHPFRAGVQNAILDLLLNHGASLAPTLGAERPAPLVNACLANGRQAAAEFLAERGAPLDLAGAAGIGRLAAVRGFFDALGQLHSNATPDQMHAGFQWACQYGRTEVAAFLLERGLNPAEFHRGQTGLHWAAYAGHPGIVALLLDHASTASAAASGPASWLEARDETWQATPLGWALHGWGDPPPGGPLDRYRELVGLLVAAGAAVDAAWLESPTVRADPRLLAALRSA
jgi:ankyrin repeat protein